MNLASRTDLASENSITLIKLKETCKISMKKKISTNLIFHLIKKGNLVFVGGTHIMELISYRLALF